MMLRGRGTLLGFVTGLVFLGSSYAKADIVYTLDGWDPLTLSGNGSYNGGGLTGTITTDGTVGPALSISNVTSWDITITVNYGAPNVPQTVEYTPANSNLGTQSGFSGLSATATDLYFNYTAYTGGFGTANFLDFFATGHNPGDDLFQFFGGNGGGDLYAWQPVCCEFTDTSGNQIIASVASTPLPAALPLFASGLGALGYLGWRRKRKIVA